MKKMLLILAVLFCSNQAKGCAEYLLWERLYYGPLVPEEIYDSGDDANETEDSEDYQDEGDDTEETSHDDEGDLDFS